MSEEEGDICDAFGFRNVDVIDAIGAFELGDSRVSGDEESKGHSHGLFLEVI